MGTESADIIRGTADMLILKLLAIQPMHGWGIAKHVEQRSKEAIRIQPGALYASRCTASRVRGGSGRRGRPPTKANALATTR